MALPLTLSAFPPLPDSRLPGLSIIIAARDEALSLETSLGSLLEQDYPELQVILVDDRSSDGTSELADTMQREHPRRDRLTVVHNLELPEGWLGKVHALHLGVQAARHPLVLFTDADVAFSPDALKRAVTAQQVLAADHLAVAPRFAARGFWEPTLVAYFFVLFSTRYRPWSVHRDKKRYVGVGAFNLVTRETLDRLGLLEPLRLQVLDDLHLGRMVKSRGGRQFALLGQRELAVRWFHGLGGLIKGLEKNAYAGLDYNFPFALGASAVAALPFLGVVILALAVSPSAALAFYLFQVLIGAMSGKAAGLPIWSGVGMPLAGLVLAYTMLRSTLLAERRGAIVWRGTSYSLRDLRRAHHAFLEKETL